MNDVAELRAEKAELRALITTRAARKGKSRAVEGTEAEVAALIA
jgi:hypothetical protein